MLRTETLRTLTPEIFRIEISPFFASTASVQLLQKIQIISSKRLPQLNLPADTVFFGYHIAGFQIRCLQRKKKLSEIASLLKFQGRNKALHFVFLGKTFCNLCWLTSKLHYPTFWSQDFFFNSVVCFWRSVDKMYRSRTRGEWVQGSNEILPF